LAKYYSVYYYRSHIPIRFVQFVDDDSQILSDGLVQHNIDVANEIFRPAEIRFFLRDNIVVRDSEFTDLYLRDASGAHILDAEGNPVHGDYSWPVNILTSPLIWPLIWPDRDSCPGFVRPPGNSEHRYHAQMRAGTYCCAENEILVYINQGPSNGGQYPWYSRIIGMSSGHMHRPGSSRNRTTFAHEIGHYLGLPHTFPSQRHFGMDYDLARIVDPPPDDEPPEGQRVYETHDNLVNPQTGETAELSLFWDLVFKPGCDSSPHVYFQSQAEAAQYDGQLQPIEQWLNGLFCVPYDSACAGVSSPFTTLELTVAAGCRGPARYYGWCSFGPGPGPLLCISPVEVLYTGDPRVAAFSRFGQTPDKIQANVMSYGYDMADGSAAEDIIERAFLCESQLEQIDRVLTYDVETKYFPGEYGLRPRLGDCTYCHDLAGP
jgi:hypothetical protein